MNDAPEPPPESLLPYEEWALDALRQVAVRALAYVAENGLPGGHHFYLTFRTDQPGVLMPTRLLAQYPQEMTIILRNRFRDLIVDEQAGQFSVTLYFGGVPASLTVPFRALVGFSDPEVNFALRFLLKEPEPEQAPEPESEPEPASEPAVEGQPQVVSLDAFRRRPGPKS